MGVKGLRKGSNIHLPFLELFSQRVYCVEKSWLGILMQCGEGFYYLHGVGIVHNDKKEIMY